MKSMDLLKRYLEHKISIFDFLANSESLSDFDRKHHSIRKMSYVDILVTIRHFSDKEVSNILPAEIVPENFNQT